MAVNISDVVRLLDKLVPPALAAGWDNVGLQIGNMHWPVQTVWVSLDPTPEVVAAACQNNVNLIVSHHPLIFKPLTSIHFQTPFGSIVDLAAKHRLSIFAAHTNLDSVTGGINDILARRIGLKDLKPLAPQGGVKPIDLAEDQIRFDLDTVLSNEPLHGVGRTGCLDKTMDLRSFAVMIKRQLQLKVLRFAGDPALPVKQAAVCSGSGSSLLASFFASGAQAYVSGDLHYHDAREVESAHLGIIDIGHFASEYLIVETLAEKLKQVFAEFHLDITVQACDLETDPFVVL
jgi:dinuclear metal center YbgI/SA1388 family protein